MPWTRLNPVKVAEQLRAEVAPIVPDAAQKAEQALSHLRDQLISGQFVAMQDHEGRTFIGTPEEAAEHMMDSDAVPGRQG